MYLPIYLYYNKVKFIYGSVYNTFAARYNPLQIDPDLADGDEDAKVAEDGTVVQDATLPTNQSLPNVGL